MGQKYNYFLSHAQAITVEKKNQTIINYIKNKKKLFFRNHFGMVFVREIKGFIS